jgi:hypothetical protein
MQENNKIDFKIGDLVTIKSRPNSWASLCCSNPPFKSYSSIEYPYTARIIDIKIGVNDNSYLGAKIGDYGWDLTELIEKDLITNVNHRENEIIPIPEKLMNVWQRGGIYKYKRVVFAKIGNKVLAWDNYEKTFAAVLDFAEEIQ